MQVTAKPIPWPRGEKQRIAGVSSFGFSGTNAHLILAEAPELAPPTAEIIPRSVHILTLSAQNQNALKQLADRYHQHIAANPSLRIEDICFTANTGRSHLKYRLAIVASSTSELLSKLATFTAAENGSEVFTGRVESLSKVAFSIGQYSGQFFDSRTTTRQGFQPTGLIFFNCLPRANLPKIARSSKG